MRTVHGRANLSREPSWTRHIQLQLLVYIFKLVRNFFRLFYREGYIVIFSGDSQMKLLHDPSLFSFLQMNVRRFIFVNENQFQASLIKELKDIFPGCIIMKNDPNYIQGIPDLMILYNNKWAALECKKNGKASRRPNQEYYVDLMDRMSFARFIFPENRKEVIDELQKAFRAGE